jgi:hypothetical protein
MGHRRQSQRSDGARAHSRKWQSFEHGGKTRQPDGYNVPRRTDALV